MNPKVNDHQEIYLALVTASNKVSEAMKHTFEKWREVHEAFEAKTNPIYSRNKNLQMDVKVKATTGFTTPTTIDVTLPQVAQNLNEQTNQLAERNKEMQQITLQLGLLGNKSLPKELALAIQASQERILKTSLQINEVAKEAQKLFQAQAMLSGGNTASPSQKVALDAKLKELNDLNKVYKDEIKKQAKSIHNVKQDLDAGNTLDSKASTRMKR